MTPFLAVLPIAVPLLLLAFQVRALYAGLVALVGTAVLTALAFPTPVGEIAEANLSILDTAVELAMILFGGILLSELMNRTGAQARLGDWIGRTSGSRSRAVLLVVLGVTPFAESITGFGVGVIVAIPLLRQLGLSPFRAAVVGILGLVTIPWGSLAPGSMVAAELGGVGFQELGVVSALLSAPVFLINGAAALVVAFGVRRAARSSLDLLVAVSTLWAAVWAVNSVVGPPLAGVVGGLTVVLVLLLVSRVLGRSDLPSEPVARSLAPYAFLIASLLLSRGALAVLGAEQGWWSVLSGPGGWLLATALLTPWLLGVHRPVLGTSARAAVERWWPVMLTTLVFLAVGVLITVTGMSHELAGAATSLGGAYLLLAPWVGAVGGFLAASNTGANAMFASSQAVTAQALGYPVVQMVGVQNVSAALASGAAVSKVVLAIRLAEAPVNEPVGTSVEHAAEGSQTTSTALQEPEESTTPRAVLLTVLSVQALSFLTLGALSLLWW